MSPASDEVQGLGAPTEQAMGRGRAVPRTIAVPILAVLVVLTIALAAHLQSLRGDLDHARERADRAERDATGSAAAFARLQTTADELREKRRSDAERLEKDGWEADDEPGIYLKEPAGATDPRCPEGGCVVVLVRTDSVRSCPDELTVDALVANGDDVVGTISRSVKKVEADSSAAVVFESKALEAGDGIRILTIECS